MTAEHVRDQRDPAHDDGRDAGPAPTVAVVDDSTLVREGIRALEPQIAVVGTFRTVEELLAAGLQADVVLLDLRLRADEFEGDGDSVGAGVQGARGVQEVVATGARILVYTEERRRMVLAGCLAAGAHGISHKSDPADWTVAAIRTVARGGTSITPAVAGVVELAARRGALTPVTGRKLEVLRGRARGESYKSLGARLFIAPSTAEEYMSDVTRRFAEFLRAHSAADLERYLGVGTGDLLDPDSFRRP